MKLKSNLVELNLPLKKTMTMEEVVNTTQIIQNKIQNMGKELTAWDFLNISAEINSADECAATINNLLSNSSAIVNCDSFDYNDEAYYRGDIIYKRINGTTIHILSSIQGGYVPEITELGDNKYQIVYNYSSTTPIEQSKSFELNIKQPEGINVYNYVYTLSSGVTFPLQTMCAALYHKGETTTFVDPVVRFYDKRGEEILSDYYIDIDETGNITIGIPTYDVISGYNTAQRKAYKKGYTSQLPRRNQKAETSKTYKSIVKVVMR